jgi:hypothetical protein
MIAKHSNVVSVVNCSLWVEQLMSAQPVGQCSSF